MEGLTERNDGHGMPSVAFELNLVTQYLGFRTNGVKSNPPARQRERRTHLLPGPSPPNLTCESAFRSGGTTSVAALAVTKYLLGTTWNLSPSRNDRHSEKCFRSRRYDEDVVQVRNQGGAFHQLRGHNKRIFRSAVRPSGRADRRGPLAKRRPLTAPPSPTVMIHVKQL